MEDVDADAASPGHTLVVGTVVAGDSAVLVRAKLEPGRRTEGMGATLDSALQTNGGALRVHSLAPAARRTLRHFRE